MTQTSMSQRIESSSAFLKTVACLLIKLVALEEEEAELGFLKRVFFFFDDEDEREEDEEEAMVMLFLYSL